MKIIENSNQSTSASAKPSMEILVEEINSEVKQN